MTATAGVLNGQKTWTTSAHFAEWYWVGARTDPEASKHAGITLFLVPLDHPGITVNAIWTMGDERTNEVYLDDVFVSDDYVVGELNHGFQYISEALDLERFTMFTFSPIAQRLDVLCDYVADAERDGAPLRHDPIVRQRIAQLATQAEVARVLGLAFVNESSQGGAAPTDGGIGLQALCHRTVQASGQRVDGHRRPRLPAAGEDARRPHGGPGRVDLPLHGDRHHRRRRPRRSRRTSSPAASSGSPRTSDGADATGTGHWPARRGDGPRPVERRPRGALHPARWPTTAPPW